MFIDLTRLGGVKIIRVRLQAIAYLDATSSGCNVSLIGGETLRVNEDQAEVERRCGGDVPAPAVKPRRAAPRPPAQPKRGPRKTR